MNNNINNDTHQEDVIDEIDLAKVSGSAGLGAQQETPAPEGYEKTEVQDGFDKSALCPVCGEAMEFKGVNTITSSPDWFYTFKCNNVSCTEFDREYIKTLGTEEWFRKIR